MESKTGKYHYSWTTKRYDRFLINVWGNSSWIYTSADVAYLASIAALSLMAAAGDLEHHLPGEDELIGGLVIA